MPFILRNLDLQITIWENLTSRKKTLTSKLGPAWENIAGNHCGKKKIAFSVSDTGGTLENKLNNLKPLFDLFSHKKCFTFWKWSKKMLLHWRTNLADQNEQQPLKINIPVTYHTVLSVWNKPLIDTCQHCSTSRANQALCSLTNAGFQNRGVCLQAFPFFPSPSPHLHFLALVSFLAQPKPRITFLGLSLLWNQTETLPTQAMVYAV